MKKLLTFSFLAIVFSLIFYGCSDDANGDTFVETNYEPQGTLVSASNVVNGFYDFVNQDDAFVAFDVVSAGENASAANIYISFNNSEAIQYASVSSVPSTVNVTLTEALAALNISNDDIVVGDLVTFSFDGDASGSTFRSSTPLNIPISCRSTIGGTYDYVSTNLKAANGDPCPTGEVTGTVTFKELGGGEFLVSDLGFGQYPSSCWADGPATSGNAKISDVCNELISGGLDQYNLVYIWNITDNSGADLSISWSNNYGDSGDVVITRPDGSDWPPLFTN